jgi:hypothetical protein
MPHLPLLFAVETNGTASLPDSPVPLSVAILDAQLLMRQ